ncbi:MAG: hypothetical protein ACRDSL_23880, partial [Pseudonocardiaceae bacterium]
EESAAVAAADSSQTTITGRVDGVLPALGLAGARAWSRGSDQPPFMIAETLGADYLEREFQH